MNYLNGNNQDYIQIKEVHNTPRDSISQVKWLNDSNFAISSWDGSFRIYSLQQNYNKNYFQQEFKYLSDQPITCFVYIEQTNTFFLGLLNGKIVSVEMNKNESVFGDIINPVTKILYAQNYNMLLAFDSEACLTIWKLSDGNKMSFKFKKNFIDADFENDILVCIFQNNYFTYNKFEDILKNEIIKFYNSDLNSELSKIKIHKSGQEILIGSADGRGLIVKVQKSSYDLNFEKLLIWKAHFTKQGLSPTFYQVNQVGFCYKQKFQNVYTVGSDGEFKIWEYNEKNLCKDQNFKAPVTACDLNENNQLVIVALGYDWTEGIWKFETIDYRPEILIMQLKNDDFEPEKQTSYYQLINLQ